MTRKRGTCVLVGLPPGNFPVPLFEVVANCITIRGSFVGNREDMAEALAFGAEGKVKAERWAWARSSTITPSTSLRIDIASMWSSIQRAGCR